MTRVLTCACFLKHVIEDSYKDASLQHMNQLYAPKEKDPSNMQQQQQYNGTNAANDVQSMDDDTMLITAYRRDIIGMTCFVLYALETAGMVVLLLVMTYDYYNDFLLFRGDKLIQTSVRMALHHQ